MLISMVTETEIDSAIACVANSIYGRADALIGHASSSTTLDIYLHSTDKMQKEAARSIGRGIRGISKVGETHEELNTDGEKTAPKQRLPSSRKTAKIYTTVNKEIDRHGNEAVTV